MNWTQKSPGIWQAKSDGFIITKIQGAKKWMGVDDKGKSTYADIFSFVAVMPGSENREVIKFVAATEDAIIKKIKNSQVQTLF